MLSKVLQSICLLAALTAAAQADGLVTEVKVRQSQDVVKIVIPASASVQHRSKTVDKSLIIDLFPAKLGNAVKEDYGDHRGLVSGVHLRQCGEHIVRITIDTSVTPSYQLTELAGGKGLVLAVRAMKPGQDARSKHLERNRVTCRFNNADLGDVVKFLVKAMGRKHYISPKVKGLVTVRLNDVPAESALKLVLTTQKIDFGYELTAPNSVIVATPEMFMRVNYPHFTPKYEMRQEIILENLAAARVISFLESQYKGAKFTRHPTLNGFYVTGTKRDVLNVKRDILVLDRDPDVPTRDEVKISYGDIFELKELLNSRVPEVTCTVDYYNNCVVLEGLLYDVSRARGLLNERVRESLTENWFTTPSATEPRSSPR